jgi:hypothetical protein
MINNINVNLMQLEWIKKLKWINYEFKLVSGIIFILKIIFYSNSKYF